jgi:hypothetical protein
VARAAAREIAKKPNVLYVTLGEKRRKGVRTGQLSLVAYVTKKSRIHGNGRIPRHFNLATHKDRPYSIKTDVVEVHNIPCAFGARSGHLLRAFDGDIGVCGLSFVKNTRGYLITNAHVVCDVAHGDTVGNIDPGLLDRETNTFFDVGPVIYATPIHPGMITTTDFAVIRSDNITVDHFMILDIPQPIKSLGPIVQTPNVGYWYTVNGTSFSCSFPEPIVTTATIIVDGVPVPYAKFWKLQMVQGAAMKGHSGALLCRNQGGDITACGLIFGGIEPNYVYAFDMRPIFNSAWDLVQ